MKFHQKYILLIVLLFLHHFAPAQTITTIAGCGVGDDSIATSAELFYPHNVAVDSAGNVYIAEAKGNRVRKVDRNGYITTVAGNGFAGYGGDGGPATLAALSYPSGIATDNIGNIYIADQGNNLIRKVTASGMITTFAGTGAPGYSGDGGPADSAKFNSPVGLAFDRSDNLYIADNLNNCVRKITSAGIITTFAGNGIAGSGGDGGAATLAGLYAPWDIVADNKGNIYISDFGNNKVRKVDTGGIITTIAGTGTYGYSGDGGPATLAELSTPNGVTVDAAGNVFFSDSHNFYIRKVDTNGIITSIAGNGIAGFRGDDGPADSAEFSAPSGLTIDKAGNIYISDTWNNRVRKLTNTGFITTLAGQSGLFEDGIPATNAELSVPYNVAVDTAGNIYIPDYYNNRIRKISVSGTITTVAGNGVAGTYNPFSGDGGNADSARIFYPSAVAIGKSGNIYIADYNNNRIRMVNAATGIITTIAGDGSAVFSGDGGPATAAGIGFPLGVAVDDSGNVYVASQENERVRKINTSGIISTVAGHGVFAYSGDGSAATAAGIDPADIAVDEQGNLYIADEGNDRIREVDTAGIITTIAGTGIPGFSGDGAAATAAQLNRPSAIKTDIAGNVYCTDANQRVRMIDATGIIATIAGNGMTGFSGDGGAATDAQFNGLAGVAADQNGNIYIADGYNNRIRKISGPLFISSVNKHPSSINVYPDPATTSLTITSQSTITNITVTDLSGKKEIELPHFPPTKNQTINISNLKPGIYIITVNHINADKFIKQ